MLFCSLSYKFNLFSFSLIYCCYFHLGFVHITEATHSLLKRDEFQFEPGPPYISSNKGLRTFLFLKEY